MPQLDPSTFPSQLFWLCISFGILWIGLKFLLPDLAAIIKKRRRYMLSHLQKARDIQKLSEKIAQEQEQRLALAIKEAKRAVDLASEKSHLRFEAFVEKTSAQLSQEEKEKRQLVVDSYQNTSTIVSTHIPELRRELLSKINHKSQESL